jgi:hypothetical protein
MCSEYPRLQKNEFTDSDCIKSFYTFLLFLNLFKDSRLSILPSPYRQKNNTMLKNIINQ